MRNVVIAALLLSCSLGTAANAQQFAMKISSPTINDVTQEWAKEFAASLKARVGDKIKVEFYPASQLGQIPATVEGVAMGTIEAVAPASGFLIGLEPRMQVFDAPGLFNDMALRRVRAGMPGRGDQAGHRGRGREVAQAQR
jgi:TRAP-type transport system periplasmic protein